MMDGSFILATSAIHLITMVPACLLGLTKAKVMLKTLSAIHSSDFYPCFPSVTLSSYQSPCHVVPSINKAQVQITSFDGEMCIVMQEMMLQCSH